MRKLSNHQYQNGVVLFIALIALVVMSLAAAALIRSVDTNATIAGNLSFQQSAQISASRGGEAALDWLETNAVNGLDGTLDTEGYYANYGNLNGSGVNLDEATDLRNDNTWTRFGKFVGEEADTKNKIDYIIERMCSKDKVAPANDDTNKCVFGLAKPLSPDKEGETEYQPRKDPASLSPLYRVTIRVTGPRNTQSYSQLYVY